MIDIEKLKRIAQAAFSPSLTGIAAIDAELEFHCTFGPSGVLDLIAEVQKMERAIKLQANAARTGMDSAKRASGIQLQLAEQARAESSPDALASERAANAMLTEENEQLQEKLQTPLMTRIYRNAWHSNGFEGLIDARVAEEAFMDGAEKVLVYYGEARIFTTLAEFMEAYPKPDARECSKCGHRNLPAGAYCKGIDCPLNPAQAKEWI